MKLLIVFATLFVASVYCAKKEYTSRFNNIDLDAIMKNERLLKSYFNCLITGRGCTPDGEELRNIIPDVLQTGCEKCSAEHIEGAKKMANFLITKKPDLFKKLLQKYDPDKKYRIKWDAQLREQGFDPDLFNN